MKLYVWNGEGKEDSIFFFQAWTNGVAFTLAESLEEAKAIIMAEAEKQYKASLNKRDFLNSIQKGLDEIEPLVIEKPQAVIIFGSD